MCGRKSRCGSLVLVVLLLLCSGSLWAEERPPVQIPYQTWVLLQEKIKTLGTELDRLTVALNEQETKRIEERKTYEDALNVRDERVKTLTESLTKSIRESDRKGKWLVGTSVATGLLTLVCGGLVWLLVG